MNLDSIEPWVDLVDHAVENLASSRDGAEITALLKMWPARSPERTIASMLAPLVAHLAVLGSKLQKAEARATAAEARATAAESAVALLKAEGVLRDRGVYDDHETYRRGDLVSRGGAWVAQRHDIRGIRPGDEPANVPDRAWRLVVQRGRDGRDLR